MKGGKIMLALLLKMLKLISPELRAMINTTLDAWEVKAKETDTVMDDVLVAIAKMLFGCST
jgi:hypothetical protein